MAHDVSFQAYSSQTGLKPRMTSVTEKMPGFDSFAGASASKKTLKIDDGGERRLYA